MHDFQPTITASSETETETRPLLSSSSRHDSAKHAVLDALGTPSATRAHLHLLQSLIRAASPNPPGSTLAAASICRDYLNAHSLTSETLFADPHSESGREKAILVSEFTCGDPDGPRLVLNGHLDAFPVDETDLDKWDRRPYSGDIEPPLPSSDEALAAENGAVVRKIHGRGVVDMKAGSCASLVAFAALYSCRRYLRGSVALVLPADEETGGRLGTAWLLAVDEKRWGGDCMLSGEPGGLGTIRFAEKGTLRITVTVRAKGGHGAYLHLSKGSGGAVRLAAEVIRDVVADVEGMEVPALPEGLEEYMRKRAVEEAVDGAMGAGAHELVLRPTVNVGVIRGGVKVNMIPEVCVFEADIRYPIGTTREAVLHVLNAAAQKHTSSERGTSADVQVQQAASNPPGYSPFEHKMVDILSKNTHEVTKGKRRPIAVPSLGATDCKHYRYHGIPAYVLGPSPATLAQVNECMDVEDFLVTVKVHVAAAWDFSFMKMAG